jgi:hypothetical protein
VSPLQDLAAIRLALPHNRGYLGVVADFAQQEHGAFQWSQAFQHDQERERERFS